MEPAPTAEPDSADWRPQPDATRLLDSESDLISTSPEGKTDALTAISLPLAFPRNWPSVFKESVALKTLVNKKNLNGVRCRAVELTTDAMEAARSAATKAKVELHPLHSFDNATRLSAALGWTVVKGFIVLESGLGIATETPKPGQRSIAVTKPTVGTAFLAMRHWWNATSDGMWVDLTPPVDETWLEPYCIDTDLQRVLLVESALGEKEAPPEGITPARRDFAIALARRLAKGGETGEFEPAGAEKKKKKKVKLPSGPAAEAEGDGTAKLDAFIAAAKFEGPKSGYVFKSGEQGTGYYREDGLAAAKAAVGGEGEKKKKKKKKPQEEEPAPAEEGGTAQEVAAPEAAAAPVASADAVDVSDASATQTLSLSQCARCDGCGSPASDGDAASAAIAAKAFATAALKNGDLPAAACLYLEAAKRDPESHTHLSNLSLVLLRIHQSAGGGALAAGIVPGDGAGGAAVHAVWAARKCLRLEPTFPKGYYRLGSALMALPGRAAAAKRAFEAGLQHASGAEEAELRTELDKVVAQLRRSRGGAKEEADDDADADADADEEEAREARAEAFVAKMDAESHKRAIGLTGGLTTCTECLYALCASCMANEQTSLCKCPSSNFGEAYCDSSGPRTRMGAPGGKKYTGPFKSPAQIAMERKLTSTIPGHVRLERCSYFGCGQPLPKAKSLLCTRCRSVVFCSQQCATAAWSGAKPKAKPSPPPEPIPGGAAAELIGQASDPLASAEREAERLERQLAEGGENLSEIERAELAAAAIAAKKRAEELHLARKLATTASATGAANAASAAAASAALQKLLPAESASAALAEFCGVAPPLPADDAAAAAKGSSGQPADATADGATAAAVGLGGDGLDGGDADEALFGPWLIASVSGHKGECGPYVRPEETPVVSARLRRYHEEHRRYPTPMPTATQLAPEYKPTGKFLMFPGGGCRWVEDDEVIPNPFAGGGGGGGGGGPPGGQQSDPMPKAKH